MKTRVAYSEEAGTGRNVGADLLKSDYLWLVALQFLIFALIIMKAASDPDGYLSPDSTNYLALAQNLLDGNGLTVANNGRGVAESSPFAIWPIGYPSLIYLISKITGATVFWSSKILNLAIMASATAILYSLFRPTGLFYAVLLGGGAFIEIFSYTWSETIFIVFLIVFSALLSKLLADERNVGKLSILASITLVSVCLFLSRYIGAFSIGILGLAALYRFWQGKKWYGVSIAICAVASFAICALYLVNNKLGTGYYTGMPRSSAAETHIEIVIQLLIAVLRGAFFPLYAWNPLSPVQDAIVAAYIAALFFVVREIRRGKVRLLSPANFDATAFSFLAVGSSYLASIIAIRWVSDFDKYDFRLLGPGALLILIALLRQIEVANRSLPSSVRAFIGVSVILSILAQGHSLMLSMRKGLSYRENMVEVYNAYKSVPAGSIVVFPSRHLAYLRPDLHLGEPRALPDGSVKESMSELLQSLDKTREVYVYIPRLVLNEKYYDSTWNRFIETHKVGSLVKMNSTQ
jgi:hypothetical protein